MAESPSLVTSASRLSAALERWIEQRTGGRVHCLQVETGRNTIVIRGYTGSYHVRQLALNAVLDAMEGQREPGKKKPTHIEMRIKVGI